MSFSISDPAESGLGTSDVLLLRFDERTRPSDATGNHVDCDLVLTDEPALVEEIPPLVETVKGRGRRFGVGAGYVTSPLGNTQVGGFITGVGGSVGIASACGVAAVVTWDFDSQVAYGDDGVLVSQFPDGDFSVEVRLEVVDPMNRIGRVRMSWMQSGTEYLAPGGEFVVPREPFVVCASREHVGANFIVRYSVAGVDLGTYTQAATANFSFDETVSIGCRASGTSTTKYFHGVMDVLHVVSRGITAEEAELMHWALSIASQRGYALARDSQHSRPDHPGANPINESSYFQRELRVEGIGHAMVRRSVRRLTDAFLPDRAWGSLLRWWEAALGKSPRSNDSIAARRARTQAGLARVQSLSRAHIQDELAESLGYGDDPTLAEIIEYGDEYSDAMTQLAKDGDNLYASGHAHTAWLRAPNAHFTFTSPGGGTPYLDFAQSGTDDLRYRGWIGGATGATFEDNAPMYLRYVGSGERYPEGGRRALIRGELRSVVSFPTNDVMAGVVIGSVIDDEWLWVGVRWTGAQYDLVSCAYVAGVLDTTFTVHATNIGAPARFFEVWHLGDGVNNLGQYKIRQAATTGGLTAATQYTRTGGPSRPEFGGYSVTARGGAATITGPMQVRFGAWYQRAPDGEGNMNGAVYRDPADAGAYDVLLANEVLQAVMPYDRSATAIDRKTGLSVANAKALLDLDPLEH